MLPTFRMPESISVSAPYTRYRIGDAFLEVRSDDGPFLEALAMPYGECEVPRSDPGAPRVQCDATRLPGSSLLLLRFAGHPIPSFVDVARRLFWSVRALQCYVEAPCVIPEWRTVVNSERGGHLLLACTADTVLIDLAEAPNDFVIDCLLEVMQSVQPSVLFLHAAALSINGSGVLLVGRSRRGKSTTAISLAARGHGFYGDDVAAVRLAQRHLIPFRRCAALRAGPLTDSVSERLERCGYSRRKDPDGTIRKLVQVGTLFPSTEVAPVKLKSAFFLNGFAEASRVTPYQPGFDDVQRLHEMVVTYRPTPGYQVMRFLQVLDLLSTLQCYLLELGPPEETVATIEGVMA